jgi:hypothetical protein
MVGRNAFKILFRILKSIIFKKLKLISNQLEDFELFGTQNQLSLEILIISFINLFHITISI